MNVLQIILTDEVAKNYHPPCDTWLVDMVTCKTWSSSGPAVANRDLFLVLADQTYDKYVIVFSSGTELTNLDSLDHPAMTTIVTRPTSGPREVNHIVSFPCGPIIVDTKVQKVMQLLFYMLKRIPPDSESQLINNAYEAQILFDEVV